MDPLLDSAPCGFLRFGDDGTIVNINHTLLDWLGYTHEELSGKSVEAILTIPSRIFYSTHFFPLLKLHLKADEIFLSLLTKDKKDLPMLSNSVRRVEGSKYLSESVFIPIHARRKYEDEIINARRDAENALKENKELANLSRSLEVHSKELDKQNQKLLAINADLLQFNRIISHDLQEPIHKIQLFADILATADELISEKKRHAIKRINAACERLRLLTHGLQEYINVDSDKTYTVVDLTKVLHSAKTRVIEETNFRDFILNVSNLPSIEGLAVQLELLFFHLIDNAVKFRHEHEALNITVTSVLTHENLYRNTAGKYEFVEHVKIIFSDNGMGFENEYANYVFGLVKKVDTVSHGLGNGLALIKKIVANHAGSIQVHSEVGKGTEVSILLPVKQ